MYVSPVATGNQKTDRQITPLCQMKIRELLLAEGSRDSSAGITAGWTIGIRGPTGARDFTLLHSVETGSGAHPSSLPVAIGSPSPGVKQPQREADTSPPSSSEVRTGGATPPLPDTSSWRGA
jgi:hypothetical protein